MGKITYLVKWKSDRQWVDSDHLDECIEKMLDDGAEVTEITIEAEL